MAGSTGSEWLRWDPHLHAPGTLKNDQFNGDWAGYVAKLRSAEPAVAAIGVTDYFCLRTYKEVSRRRAELPGIRLIFPNVELRLTIETRYGDGINLHLLVSPEDPEHVTRTEQLLGRLKFDHRGDTFVCTEDGLRRLGRTHTGNAALEDEAALRDGANQFKVDLNALRDLLNEEWARRNILVAVASGNDGLGGLAKDSGFDAQREELGRYAHIIFSSKESDRAFWRGDHPDFAAKQLRPKPCLHGSDAHTIESVLQPALGRRCWIKGGATFESLRQALVEPERRVFIGELPPPGPPNSDVIGSVSFRQAPWLRHEELVLNNGLVAIIGAKGSGKTALADMIAHAAGAGEANPGPASFVGKAGRLLDGVEVVLHWRDGSTQQVTFGDEQSQAAQERVRYLSQSFVERLCTQSGLAEALVEEIERVVFLAIPEEERLQCSAFGDLRELVLRDCRGEREALRETIAARTATIAELTRLNKSLPTLKSRAAGLKREREALQEELKQLPRGGTGNEGQQASEVAAALQRLRDAIAAEERRAKTIRDLTAELRRIESAAKASVDRLREAVAEVLDHADRDQLSIKIPSDVYDLLGRREREAHDRGKLLRERGIAVTPEEAAKATIVKTAMGLAPLQAESQRLEQATGVNKANLKRRLEIEKRVGELAVIEERLAKEIAEAEAAPERRRAAIQERYESFAKVIETLVEEERAIAQLYSALKQRIGGNAHLSKLTFDVRRTVDLEGWTRKGEELLDLRKPPFQGRGLLLREAQRMLQAAWTDGSPADVRAALEAFISKYGPGAVEALIEGKSPRDLGEWLFSTDHVSIRYGIQYEGVELGRLSPGTRGVVLLTLYLALDLDDSRPLVIDQPEENLDPHSVFGDLVPFFRHAALRRQIIMVTHNANLVVNTDADQVLVARSTRRSPKDLPEITYGSGGLEIAETRADVCRLLEGGEDAFRKRGQRYGLPQR